MPRGCTVHSSACTAQHRGGGGTGMGPLHVGGGGYRTSENVTPEVC